MVHSFRLSSLLLAPLLLVVAVAGASAGTRSSATAAPVKTAAAHILVDAKGMTLYVYAKDTKGKSNCTGQCAQFWPPLLPAKGSKAPATMAGFAGTFGEITRAGGADQLTYDGAPLYTFANDKKPGDINGQGVAGLWWAVVVPSNL
jgi:predicted lipoprotein with Yx(FWY)xxD motif